jgi:type I restriction enzyme M protein
MKDRQMLSRYALAKPALKRAGDKKAPKEERDVLFIERILKWLKPGGRAAIVLPQGKFNNSSLAFIREWILKKARLLAVVGLHPNTFKPHTGTKTSVLFIQKYTADEIKTIDAVHEQCAKDCPAYEKEIQQLLDEKEGEIPEDAVPEAIADLLAETFAEPEDEEEKADGEEDGNGAEDLPPEELAEKAEERISELKQSLINSKQKLEDLNSDIEAMQEQHKTEIETAKSAQTSEVTSLQDQHKNVIKAETEAFEGTAKERTAHLKPIKEEQKIALKALKDGHRESLKSLKDGQKESLKALKEKQKEEKKKLNARIKKLGTDIPTAEVDLKKLTTRGQMELVLADEDLIGTLKERWISAKVSEELDYPVFMAVSERGGKNNSGDYEYMTDKDGSLLQFPDGHPQEGQYMIDQDLVNFDIGEKDLEDASKLADENLCIAEAFVRFAQEQKFNFWGKD